MSYTIIDHIHNYAVWTAARAVQINFTTTRNINEAINHVGLKNMLYNNEYMTIEAFDTFHRVTANGIMDFLADQRIITSYGQAAKIIAIYLKTAVVIKDSGISNISKIVHPPIDSILLGRLHTEHPEL